MDSFTLEVDHKGKLLEFPGRLATFGYTHKIIIEVENIELVFEPDEERNYRAVVLPEQMNKIDAGLVRSIAAALEEALK